MNPLEAEWTVKETGSRWQVIAPVEDTYVTICDCGPNFDPDCEQIARMIADDHNAIQILLGRASLRRA